MSRSVSLCSIALSLVLLAVAAPVEAGSYAGGRGAISGIRNFHRPPKALSPQAARFSGIVRAEDYRRPGQTYRSHAAPTRTYTTPTYAAPSQPAPAVRHYAPTTPAPIYHAPAPPTVTHRRVYTSPTYTVVPTQTTYRQPTVIYSAPQPPTHSRIVIHGQ